MTKSKGQRLIQELVVKYDDLYTPFSKKHFNKSEIYSMSNDEWRDIFE